MSQNARFLFKTITDIFEQVAELPLEEQVSFLEMMQNKVNGIKSPKPAFQKQAKNTPDLVEGLSITQKEYDALQAWPKPRKYYKEGRRLENSWQYMKRVVDPDRLKSLYFFQLKPINKQLYTALGSLMSRHKKQYLEIKSDEVDQKIIVVAKALQELDYMSNRGIYGVVEHRTPK